MGKDAYYFSHDSNAKDDPKCVLLIELLGLEGYGIYWMLIETLRDQPDYTYPIALLPALARRYNTTFENVKTVVFNCELFVVKEDKIFFSESLNRRMNVFNEVRLKRSEAGKLGNEKRWAIAKASQCDRKGIASKVNKSKVNNKESIKKKAIAFVSPSLSEVENYFIEKGYTVEVAKKAFGYYDTAEWRDSTGKAVKNWKQKMISTWFKSENKQTSQTQKANDSYTINI